MNIKHCLFKISSREHMESLLNDGHVFMNQFSYYRNKENNENDIIVGDKNDGLTAYYSGLDKILTCQLRLETSTLTFHPTEMKVSGDYDKRAVYCMYGMESIKPNPITLDIVSWSQNVDKRILYGFGDTIVMIRNPNSFIKKINRAALKLGYELFNHPVEYVSRNSQFGKMGPFTKFEEYKYQSEVRFVTNKSTDGPLLLKLGSLADNAVMIDLNTMRILHC